MNKKIGKLIKSAIFTGTLFGTTATILTSCADIYNVPFNLYADNTTLTQSTTKDQSSIIKAIDPDDNEIIFSQIDIDTTI
jgi:hypothetical protein